jgi:putative transposase
MISPTNKAPGSSPARKFRRAVRLPEGDVPGAGRQWVSKSAASRHFVALSAARMKEWMTSDLSKLDLLVVQIDGIHMTGELVRGCQV